MASSGINLAGLTAPNGAVQSIRELIILETLKSELFEQFITPIFGVHTGDKQGGVGEFPDVGLAKGAGCTPNYNANNSPVIERTWSINDWEVAEKMCYEDVLATLAKYDLNEGTDIADLTDTIMVEVVTPAIEAAIMRMYWRLIWFGDTAATNVVIEDLPTALATTQTTGSAISGTVYAGVASTTSGAVKCALANETVVYLAAAAATGNAVAGTTYYSKDTVNTTEVISGGSITAGKNANLFKIEDGFFKRLITIVTADANRKTTIAANAQATKALQKSNFTNAITVMDNLITDAPLKLRENENAIIVCTQSFADAYRREITLGTKYTDMQWETLANGMKAFTHNGVKVIPFKYWDVLIQEYYDNTRKWDSPHRAVYYNPANFLVGTPSSQMLKTFKTWFSDDDQDVKMLARDWFGTMIFETDQVQIAI